MELRSGAVFCKQILCIGDGRCLGYPDELLLEWKDGEREMGEARIRALVVRGRLRWLGLLGRDPDLLIPWEDLLIIGEDAILVRCAGKETPTEEIAGRLPSLWKRLRGRR